MSTQIHGLKSCLGICLFVGQALSPHSWPIVLEITSLWNCSMVVFSKCVCLCHCYCLCIFVDQFMSPNSSQSVLVYSVLLWNLGLLVATDHAHCDLSGHWKDKKHLKCAKLLFVDVVAIVVIVIVVAMILVKIVRSLYLFNILYWKAKCYVIMERCRWVGGVLH